MCKSEHFCRRWGWPVRLVRLWGCFHTLRLNCANTLYRNNHHVDIYKNKTKESGIFPLKWPDEVDTQKSTTLPSSDSLELPFIWRLVGNVTMKCIGCDTESFIIHPVDDAFQGVMEDHVTHATHPTWSHALSWRWIVCVIWFLRLLAYLCRLVELPQSRRLNT